MKPSSKAIDDNYFLIVGMGSTGVSIARYLTQKGYLFHFFDTRSSLEENANLQKLFPTARQYFAQIDAQILNNAIEIYISPGVSRDETVITEALALGKSVVGDVELFLREVEKPVIGITGSNGKSTVTTLVGLAAERSGIKAAIGGNIGTPALELLNSDVDLFVLELSSFQLESTFSQKFTVACNLNVTEDHMDRYDSFDAYVAAKRRIFSNAQYMIFNTSDESTLPMDSEAGYRIGFGLSSKGRGGRSSYYWDEKNNCLTHNDEKLIEKSDIKSKGMHNVENALALFAIARAVGIKQDACRYVLSQFNGLPHRCEIVAYKNQVTFINDSKATNVGAAMAAVLGLRHEFNALVLIVGGEGKGADFSELASCINENVRVLVALGKDGTSIARLVRNDIKKFFASDMESAVKSAFQAARQGEAVLLSPACASFDMFQSFEDRGEIFARAAKRVNELGEAS